MQEVQSTITNVQASGTWDSQHGLLFKFDYTMSDGTTIQAMHKTEQHLPIGATAFYTVKKDNNFGKSGKVSLSSAAAFGGQQQAPQQSRPAPQQAAYTAPSQQSADKNRAFALSYAKDIAVANSSSPETAYASNAQLIEELFLNADAMIEWLNK
tara:strand:+ start:4477 stop:4938 length:462 start_codon:yes stop_codon:yes gene_type:complete